MRARRPSFCASLLVLGGLAIAAACSPDGDADAPSSGSTESSGTDGGGPSGEGGAGAAGGGDDGSGSTSAAVTVAAGTGSTTSGGGEGGGCASASISAELLPVTMLIVFDRSGSMDDSNKWNDATAALTSFVQNPEAAGLGVGLKFFPKGACDDDSCDIDACATPEVEPAPLLADAAPTDAHEAALVQAIEAEDTGGGGTPMAAALLGAHEWAQARLAQNPTDKVAIVLVTDGEPNGCGDVDEVTSVASLGAAQQVPTYAVGLLGSEEGTINAIASAGGTTSGFFIGGANTEADLLAALLAIQGQQIACELAIPDEEGIDPEKVNVTFTPQGGEEETIPQVEDAAACGEAGGWYYDDPANPTKITLCGATCSDIQGQSGELGLALGCETVVAPPPN
jgi:hypothetical protein